MVCQDAPEDVGTYKAKATAEGGVTYTDAEKTISESVREKSRKTHDREERNWFLKMFTW